MELRSFVPDDVPVLYYIAQSRGSGDYDNWAPEPGFEIQVASDELGPAAFLMLRPSRADLLFADVFECEYFNGKPTKRGLRGVSMLEAWLSQTAKERGQQVFSIVDLSNLPHMQALEKRGWTKRAVIYGSNF